jgi:hypothetical protein
LSGRACQEQQLEGRLDKTGVVQDSILIEQCAQCSEHSPVVAYVGKLFPKADCSAFEAFTRIFSGSIKVGDKVRVLGEAYSPDDEEDSVVAEVTGVSVFMGRYRIPVGRAAAGASPARLLLRHQIGTVSNDSAFGPPAATVLHRPSSWACAVKHEVTLFGLSARTAPHASSCVPVTISDCPGFTGGLI